MRLLPPVNRVLSSEMEVLPKACGADVAEGTRLPERAAEPDSPTRSPLVPSLEGGAALQAEQRAAKPGIGRIAGRCVPGMTASPRRRGLQP